jgi:hypothetical protein
MEITKELFESQRDPKFGTSNPERMRNDFWEWMIRGDQGALYGSPDFSGAPVVTREGAPNAPFGPHHARKLFKVPLDRCDGPIWTFDRMGASRTELPDGRTIFVGGEHEDFYDQDFCIYNDVVVFRSGEIEIYGYPKEIFQPTDFHTATAISDVILIIGCVGYPADRRNGETPVYGLHLDGYRISTMQTSGEMPGWISSHEAHIGPEGRITVSGGSIFVEQSGEWRFRRNFDEYELDPGSLVWRRLTNRNWRQFQIRQEDRRVFMLEDRPEPKSLVPSGIECSVVASKEWNQCLIRVEGIQVSLTVGVACIEIVFEGNLPEEMCMRIAQGVLTRAEETTHRKCVLELL